MCNISSVLLIMGRIRRIAERGRLFLISRSPGMQIGRQCNLHVGARLRATDGGVLTMGNNVSIDRFSDITVKYGSVVVGSGSYIGQYSVICSRERINIGQNCLIAEHVTIRDHDHIFGTGLVTAEAGFSTSEVQIGNNVWIGAKVSITKGVEIGANAVIGSNSVVTHDVPMNTVVAGAPARILRKII